MCFLLDFNEERQAVVVYQVPKEITEVQKIEEEGLFRNEGEQMSVEFDSFLNCISSRLNDLFIQKELHGKMRSNI